LCLTETNNFIIVCQFYNTKGYPLQKLNAQCLFFTYIYCTQYTNIRMQGKENFKIINAQQAKSINNYKNAKQKLLQIIPKNPSI